MTAANGSVPSPALDAEHQAAIRAGLLATLNAARLVKPGAPFDAAGAAREEAVRARITQLEQELASAVERASELAAERCALEHAGAALKQQQKELDDKLAVALRRIEGLTEEVAAQRDKVAALEAVLRRITSHRWYRWWDKLRLITGKPALHGPRQDPLGIKGAMPS